MNEIFKFRMDACVTVKPTAGRYVIDEDPNDENESFEFARIIKDSGAKYKVTSPYGGGGGWPELEFSGTKKQLLPIIAALDCEGRDVEELAMALANWDGDEQELIDIIC